MNDVFGIRHLCISDGLPGQLNNINLHSIITKDDFWGMPVIYCSLGPVQAQLKEAGLAFHSFIHIYMYRWFQVSSNNGLP
jgi:hypothetical protein